MELENETRRQEILKARGVIQDAAKATPLSAIMGTPTPPTLLGSLPSWAENFAPVSEGFMAKVYAQGKQYILSPQTRDFVLDLIEKITVQATDPSAKGTIDLVSKLKAELA